MSSAFNPYQAPASESTESERARPPAPARPRFSTLVALGASIFIAVCGGIAATATQLQGVGTAAFTAAALMAAVGAVLGVVALVGLARGTTAFGWSGLGVALFGVLANGGMALLGGLLALLSTVQFSRGRQLRRRGKVLLPSVERGDAWARDEIPLASASVAAIDPRVAEQWRENGRTEHASVAAFARLTLDLMALGAPPALVAAANEDALDEIRHTERCFALARAIDGAAASPGAFPEARTARTLSSHRTLALAELAVDSLVDGALHEGVSARIIARLARTCEEPAIRAVLKEIAADEGRHSAHGWDVVRWCLDEGKAPVARALVGAIHLLPKQMRSPLPDEASDGSWERWGIHGHALEHEEYTKAHADLVTRVEAMVARTNELAKDETEAPALAGARLDRLGTLDALEDHDGLRVGGRRSPARVARPARP
jgi:hypothetical protein